MRSLSPSGTRSSPASLAFRESVQAVLREAALVGGTVDDRLLSAVAGRPIGEIGEALREAVAHQILVLERDGCRFRHALVREAVYDELLPGERQRLHEATATALAAQPELAGGPEHVRWALLAYHWGAAGEQPNAFAASVRAGLEAQAGRSAGRRRRPLRARPSPVAHRRRSGGARRSRPARPAPPRRRRLRRHWLAGASGRAGRVGGGAPRA